jgi:hypothetical protein
MEELSNCPEPVDAGAGPKGTGGTTSFKIGTVKIGTVASLPVETPSSEGITATETRRLSSEGVESTAGD